MSLVFGSRHSGRSHRPTGQPVGQGARRVFVRARRRRVPEEQRARVPRRRRAQRTRRQRDAAGRRCGPGRGAGESHRRVHRATGVRGERARRRRHAGGQAGGPSDGRRRDGRQATATVHHHDHR